VSRRPVVALLAVGVVAAVAVALAVFEPWKLVVDDVVDEAPPPGVVALEPVEMPTATPPPAGPSAADPPVGAPAGRPPATPAGRPSASAPAAPPASPPAATPASPGDTKPAGPTATLLARGTFISHEHDTTGTVRVLALPDGRRVLRIDDLDTSNGPDLRVWITDAPVLPGRAGWRVFDDGVHVELGRLKGNRGSQNYELPPSVDLARLRSVTVWCVRFHVSFGAAALDAG
jgi:hypothetical protein